MLVLFAVADNPKQYNDIMKPTGDAKFDDVCSFVIGCVESDMDVECTAVKIPGVNISGVRELAFALGAREFTENSYHA